MKLTVTVDGKRIPTNRFVKDIIAGVAQALVAPLKGVDAPGRIVIEVTKEE